MSANKDSEVVVNRHTGEVEVKELGALEFVHEYGNNGSKPSYQEASGAPVENESPLGLQVTWFTTIFLNIGILYLIQMQELLANNPQVK